jgi:hypothetical protein
MSGLITDLIGETLLTKNKQLVKVRAANVFGGGIQLTVEHEDGSFEEFKALDLRVVKEKDQLEGD